MTRRRSAKPSDELLAAITAAAAAGDEAEVDRLSEQARADSVDRRRHATPLPIHDEEPRP